MPAYLKLLVIPVRKWSSWQPQLEAAVRSHASTVTGVCLSKQMTLSSADMDLALDVVECKGGLKGRIDYNMDLFQPVTVSRMAGHLQVCHAAQSLFLSLRPYLALCPSLTCLHAIELPVSPFSESEYCVRPCRRC